LFFAVVVLPTRCAPRLIPPHTFFYTFFTFL
jgi:hypothetical protein